MNHETTWHRVGWEGSKKRGDRRHVLTGKTAKAPGVGVWVGILASSDSGYTTNEAIAVDGQIVYTAVCHHGQARNAVWLRAATYLSK